jgi:glutamate-1-semialdehyde 2,1-aminomutase
VTTSDQRQGSHPTITGETMTAGTTPDPDHRYRTTTRGSEQSFSAARRHLPTGVSRQTLVFPPYPLFADRGRGQYLWDVDGNRYLDLVNNYTSLIHGHAHPASVAAATAELQRGGALGAPTRLELGLAELLIERFPAIEQLRFALSGSEAVGFACRAARAYTGRTRLLKFEGGFHGSNDEVQQSISAAPLAPGEFAAGTPNSKGLLDVPTIVAVYNDLDSVRTAFTAHGRDIAAVIVEPFLGNAGLVCAAPGFLAAVADIAHQHGALFILDEIQSMRLQYGGAQEMHGVHPDITTLGKIMGGGLPLAAFGAGRDIMQVLDGFTPAVPQTGTFTAFSAALAAGLATMRAYDRIAASAINHAGETVRAGIRQIFAHHSLPACVNGQGSMFNVILAPEPVADYRTWRAAPTELWTRVRMGLLANGVYITPRGTGCISTPMTGADIDRFLTELHQAVEDATSQLEPTA